MANTYITLGGLFTAIANAIRAKKGTTDTIVAYNFPSEIESIASQPSLQSKTVSPSTTAQTITPDSGYDGLSQVVVNAISPTKGAHTYTPGKTDQTINSGQWLTGAQTIKGDANLVANNIRQRVSIFGVRGQFPKTFVLTIFNSTDRDVRLTYTSDEADSDGMLIQKEVIINSYTSHATGRLVVYGELNLQFTSGYDSHIPYPESKTTDGAMSWYKYGYYNFSSDTNPSIYQLKAVWNSSISVFEGDITLEDRIV